jgi:hypothetical protein
LVCPALLQGCSVEEEAGEEGKRDCHSAVDAVDCSVFLPGWSVKEEAVE